MSTVKEHGILFKAPMVRAILDGRKTQTRRVVTHRDIAWHRGSSDRDFASIGEFRDKLAYLAKYPGVSVGILKDRYKTGERLWVKESWRTGACFDNDSPKKIARDAAEIGYTADATHAPCPIWYVADGHHRQWGEDDEADFLGIGKVRPSMFMPRWASRITLDIKSVRIERLNDISEQDAIAEGVSCEHGYHYCPRCQVTPRQLFRALWITINGEEAWNDNPYVRVVEWPKWEAK